jgi:hypothetical protein
MSVVVVCVSRFPKGMTSGVKKIRKTAMGQGEFSFLQLKTSPYDLKLAVNKFRFCLLPKVITLKQCCQH